MLERRLERAAELARRVDAARGSRSTHLLERRVREQAGDRQRQLGDAPRAPSTTTIPPPRFASRRTRERHRRVVHPDDDDVVRVVRDRRRERAALQAEAAHEAEADPARAEVALDRPRSSPGRARGRRPPRRRATVGSSTSDVGHDLARARARSRARAPPLPRDAEHLRRRARRCAPCAAPSPAPPRAGSPPTGRPRFSTVSGTKRSRSGSSEQVGLVAGRDRAEVRRARATSAGLSVAQHERVLGRDAGRDRVAHHRVDVAVVGDVLRLAVVGAERDPARAVLGEQRQQRVQVARRRAPRGSAATCPARSRSRPSSAVYASWSERMPAAAYAFSARPSTPGAWPSTCSRERRASRARAGRRAMTPGKFIISARPITRRRRSSASRSPGVSAPARRLEARRGHARRGHEVDVERESAADVEQPVHAVGAEHVRDLVRVGDDGRRAERQHEPRELVDEQLRRLEVHVRVDEAGDDVAAGRVERLARPRSRRARRRSRRRPRRRVSSHSRVKTENTARRGRRGRPARRRARRRGGAKGLRPLGRNRTVRAVDVLTPRTPRRGAAPAGRAPRRAGRSRAAPT